MKNPGRNLRAGFLAAWLAAAAAALGAQLPAADVEFFEKQVRPILAQSCQKCHGETKQEGGLRLDSRTAALKGGDSGAAIEPGKPNESLLIEAIGYTGDIKMPPKGKLADEQIAALAEWVKRGAPWPAERPPGAKAGEFDLAARKAKQWAFQPIRPQRVPRVKNAAWPATAIDNFILAKLEEAVLSPAEPAGKRALLRRATFDLLGLPPTAGEIDAFLADDSPQAFERVVDRLLRSPHYGERWARHWLDLVRFAETRGHEYDYEMPLAFEYRDYVIRALNADVPYDQFVVEHVAGDLLAEPRRHPAERFNESVIATGFWFLGEAKHSPVDVRADEAERIDNQIDVFGKAFLGQTLGCARCHDHKFDAISTNDYYAISGYLQSSRYDVACIDPPEERLALVAQLNDLCREEGKLVAAVAREAAHFTGARVSECLLAALAVLRADFDPSLDAGATSGADASDVVFEDFEKPTYGGWKSTGNAFGEVPNRRPLPAYQGDVGALGQGFVNSHSALDREGGRTATDELTGTLTSGTLTLTRPYIHFLIGGGAHAGKTCLNLVADRKVVRTATGRNDNRMRWATFDVRDLAGKEVRLEIVDQERGGWGNIGVDHIVFSKNSMPGPMSNRIAAASKKYDVNPDELALWINYLQGPAHDDSDDPFHPWAVLVTLPHELTRETIGQLLRERAAPDQAADDVARSAKDKFVVFEDFSAANFSGWFVSGEAFGNGPIDGAPLATAGASSDALQSPLRGRMAHSGALSMRLQGVLRSRTFTIEKSRLAYHAAGKGARINLIIDGYQLLRNPIYGGLTIPLDTPNRMQWFAQDVSKWVGHEAYIELVDPGEGFLAIDRIIASDDARPKDVANPLWRRLLEDPGADSPGGMAQAYERMIVQALENLDDRAAQPVAGHEIAARRAIVKWFFVNAVNGPLARPLADLDSGFKKRFEQLEQLAKSKQRVESAIRFGRTVMAMADGTPEDDRVHVRGSPNKFGDVVPRRFLEAVAGRDQQPPATGSGRLELARALVDRSNPLLGRVIVNRVWQHHFGEGLVRSPDDLGNMGQPPTHPELLDYLAGELMEGGWSLKQLHRSIMLSRTYQMSSEVANERAAEVDPQNKLLSRMNLRRLEAESIRDAILAVSGGLDATMFGPSVLPHLTPFMVGRGRPAQSGPLDGAGRLTIYLNVRRNFLIPMLLAFDYPIPFSTIGRRSVSNVPAQALTLMNNPFVSEQAEKWARRVIAEHREAGERIQAMYISAYGRPASEAEKQEALAFISEQSRQHPAGEPLRAWADLAHVLFNVKEFIFVE